MPRVTAVVLMVAALLAAASCGGSDPGTRIVWTADGVYTSSESGGAPRQLTTFSGVLEGHVDRFGSVSSSPDGSMLAYTTGASDSTFLNVVPADGVTEGTGLARDGAWSVEWSPDGTTLAVTRGWCRAGGGCWAGSAIEVIRPDGSKVADTTPRAAGRFDTAPSWAPDGRSLCFVRYRGVDRRGGLLLVVDAAGGAPRLVRGARDPETCTWSPDGRTIVYGTADSTIRSIPANGGRSRPLVAGTSPKWSWDRDLILLVQHDESGSSIRAVAPDERESELVLRTDYVEDVDWWPET